MEMSRASTNPAVVERYQAFLTSDFGYNYAVKVFGQEAISSLPVFKKGKNKGKPKGKIVWFSCTHGGWVTGWGLLEKGKKFGFAILEDVYGSTFGDDIYHLGSSVHTIGIKGMLDKVRVALENGE